MLYFIVNNTACTGGSNAVWNEIRMVLKSLKVNYRAFRTRYAGHATELAARICKLEDDDIGIVIVGGDGTVNEVMNGISDFDRVRVGHIPSGSGNDFARGAGIRGGAVSNVTTILYNYQKGKSFYRSMDLGMVKSNAFRPRYFAISSGCGLDAIVTRKVNEGKLKGLLNKIHLGQLSYVLTTIYTLFSMQTASLGVSTDHTVKNMDQVIFLAAMNMFAEGGGVPMAPDASPCDGKLSMCAAWGIPKWLTFFLLPFLVLGKHSWIKGFELIDSCEIDIKADQMLSVHADGEYLGQASEISFRCLPGKLHLLQ